MNTHRIIDIGENPYLKLIGRMGMLFTTVIAAPVLYWMITTMIAISASQSRTVDIQTTQQAQLQKLADTQSTIIGVQAIESQTRAVSDAQFEEQVRNVKESQARTDVQLERASNRLDELAQRISNPIQR